VSTEASSPMFSILGPLRVEGPKGEVRVGGVRRRSVLLRLLASPNQAVRPDLLADDVWEGEPPSAAASTLQSHVSALRQLLGRERLELCPGGYRVAVSPTELDSLLFKDDVVTGRAAIASGSFGAGLAALERGLGRWRGSSFADVAGAGWTVSASAGLEEERNAAIEDALEARLAIGLVQEVCVLAEEAVSDEPYRERRWAALMLALYRSGRQADALRCYQRVRQMLAEELGIEPSRHLAQLENDVLSQSAALDWVGTEDLSSTVLTSIRTEQEPVKPTNLPTPLATFVGRVRELTELQELLEAHRLVSIVGAGGIGKTRLAIEAATSRVGLHRDGVWFVDLADQRDRNGLLYAVANAIGIHQTSDEPLGSILTQHTASMRALLVLDNCEHLVDSVAELVLGMLEGGTHFRVLITSREPLRVHGEVVWQTPPIETPRDPTGLDPATLGRFDAVRLFLARSNASARHLASDPSCLQVVAEISAKLDGLPLAIELAAARASVIGLENLAERVRGHAGLLAHLPRRNSARHRTMTAAIDMSYEPLPPKLQASFRRLSVFAGGFTLEAAEGAIASPPDAPWEVAEHVATLVERSLLVAGGESIGSLPARTTRYRMLEPIRQYGAGRLLDEEGPRGDTAARVAHARYFSDLARRASGALVGWQQGRWLDALELEHANISAAIAQLLGQPERAAEALQMIVCLDRFWHNRSHLVECAAALRCALDLAGPDVTVELRCSALNVLGAALIGHDGAASAPIFADSLQLSHDSNDDYNAALALTGLAMAEYYSGQSYTPPDAGRLGIEMARRVGDPVLLGQCLVSYGATMTDDPASCRDVNLEAIEVTRRSGDRIHLAWAHNNLGNTLLLHNDLNEAQGHFESAVRFFGEIGHSHPMPVVNLGWVAFNRGDLRRAAGNFDESLRVSRKARFRREGAYAVLGAACTATAAKDFERAAALLGLADAQLEACRERWPKPESTYRERCLSELTIALGSRVEEIYDSASVGARSNMLDTALDWPNPGPYLEDQVGGSAAFTIPERAAPLT
jgi:predicted ATPase/DNA-binding SARP family transcriptional activator